MASRFQPARGAIRRIVPIGLVWAIEDDGSEIQGKAQTQDKRVFNMAQSTFIFRASDGFVLRLAGGFGK
jgi:hypothetical protein